MSSIIVFLGVSLILVNGWSNGQLPIAWSIISDNTVQGINTDQQTAMLVLGGEMLFVIILASFSNTSRSFATFGMVLFIALWVAWFVKNPTQLSGLANALSGNLSGSNTPSNNSFSIPSSTFTLPSPHLPTSFTVPQTGSATTKGNKSGLSV